MYSPRYSILKVAVRETKDRAEERLERGRQARYKKTSFSYSQILRVCFSIVARRIVLILLGARVIYVDEKYVHSNRNQPFFDTFFSTSLSRLLAFKRAFPTPIPGLKGGWLCCVLILYTLVSRLRRLQICFLSFLPSRCTRDCLRTRCIRV